MYPNDPVTTAYLSRFHAVERDASAEVRRLAHEARHARPSRRPGSRRHKRVWFRRPGWVVPA
jgi:hypothetical protein